jgi:hypothetical protein
MERSPDLLLAEAILILLATGMTPDEAVVQATRSLGYTPRAVLYRELRMGRRLS